MIAPAIEVALPTGSPFSLIAAVFALALLRIITLPQEPAPTLRPIAWAGIGAYSLYLFHVPALMAVGLWGAGLILPLLAWASWRFLEAPLIGFARRRWRFGEAWTPAAHASFETDCAGTGV